MDFGQKTAGRRYLLAVFLFWKNSRQKAYHISNGKGERSGFFMQEKKFPQKGGMAAGAAAGEVKRNARMKPLSILKKPNRLEGIK